MKKLIVFLLTLNTSIQSQNLILNADFENRFSCPQYTGNINIDGRYWMLDSNLFNWRSSENFMGYLNECVNLENIPFYHLKDVPQSALGYQFAHSGEGYIGFYAFLGNPYGIPYPPNYDMCNEFYYSGYGWQHLQNPLQVGKKYYAEYYANLGDTSLYARKKIGMCFTENTPRFNPSMSLETWQLVNDTVDLTDKENWKHLQWIFTADSAYNYLQIGPASRCVGPDDTTYVGGNPTYLGLTVAFYFVDDVGLYEIQGSSSTQTFCGNTAVLNTPPGSFNHIWSNGGRQATTTINQSGTYTVFYRLDSLAISDTINVLFSPAMPANFLGNDTLYLIPQTSLTIEGPSGFTYLWNTGHTDKNLEVALPGTYILTVTDINGCMTSDTVWVVYDTTVNLDDFWQNNQLEIFPNPAKDQLFIKTGSNINCNVEVFSTTGQLLHNETFMQQTQINVSALPQGVYFVRINCNNKFPVVRKVVVSK